MEVIQLVLLVTAGVSVIACAIIAAWRLIPRLTTPEAGLERLNALEDAVEQLRLAQIDFADKWETTIRRNNTRVGRLRRKLARERGDDVDDVDDELDQVDQVVPAMPASPAPAPQLVSDGKAALWLAYNKARNAS